MEYSYFIYISISIYVCWKIVEQMKLSVNGSNMDNAANLAL